MTTLTVLGRRFTVELDKDSRDRIKYILLGMRGARYVTMRKALEPNIMFLTSGMGLARGFEQVRLTDRNGSLEVL